VFVVDFCPMLDRENGHLDFLLRVFDRVAQVLRGFGGFIPLGYLERHIKTSGVCYTSEVDTHRILDALGRIWGLFSEDPPEKTRRLEL
jgi:hypothetical protein